MVMEIPRSPSIQSHAQTVSTDSNTVGVAQDGGAQGLASRAIHGAVGFVRRVLDKVDPSSASVPARPLDPAGVQMQKANRSLVNTLFSKCSTASVTFKASPTAPLCRIRYEKGYLLIEQVDRGRPEILMKAKRDPLTQGPNISWRNASGSLVSAHSMDADDVQKMNGLLKAAMERVRVKP